MFKAHFWEYYLKTASNSKLLVMCSLPFPQVEFSGFWHHSLVDGYPHFRRTCCFWLLGWSVKDEESIVLHRTVVTQTHGMWIEGEAQSGLLLANPTKSSPNKLQPWRPWRQWYPSTKCHGVTTLTTIWTSIHSRRENWVHCCNVHHHFNW